MEAESARAAAGSSFFRKPPPPRSSSAWASPVAPADAARRRRPAFHGSGGTLFGIHVVNVFLTIVTLGVYYFWGKTRVRRYVFGQTAFEGDRFAYHGTGKELLVGFLRAFAIFFGPILVLTLVRDVLDVHPLIKAAAAFLISALFVVFIPVAMVGARRYRLSRTSWRGIRFSFRGKARDFIGVFLRGSFLTGLTFGLYYPFFVTERQAFMISHSYFGNERFAFEGRGRALFGPFLLAVLLTLPTVGLCWFWFFARKRRFFWDHTRFGAARFRSTVTGGALLGLHAVNALLLVLTLGLAWPWVRVRNVRFALRYLALEGPLDLERVQQEARAASATGEGLAGFLDTSFDLG
jgi:uncharacterized membrane protein YjgN (DUF898 family)